MSESESASPSVAANLRRLLHSREERVTVRDIVDRVEGTGGLAPVLFVLTLPVLLPLPPGVSMVLALPLLVVAPQMIVGRADLWLPERLAGQSMQRAKLQRMIERILPWVERVETVVHPRLTFLTGRVGAVLVGLVCTLMAVLLVLPIPFANLLPALTVCVLSLGLTRRDGLVVLLGLAMLAASVTGVVWGVHGARLAIDYLKGIF